MKRLTITRREQASGHIVVMIEIKGRIRYGYGKRKIKGFRPYDQSRGVLSRTTRTILRLR